MALSKKFGIIYAAIGIAAVIAIVIVCIRKCVEPTICKTCGQETCICKNVCGTCKQKPCKCEKVCENCKQKPCKCIQKDSVDKKSVERLHNKLIKGTFVMVGRGSDAKWGINRVANFQYNITVIAESRIEKKEVLSNGFIKVVEIRTFKDVRDNIVVSDVDFKLALDTIPLKTFSKLIDAAAVVWTTISGDPVLSSIVINSKKIVETQLKSLEKTSARQLLGMLGVVPSAEVENYVKKLASQNLFKALSTVRSVSGKSYRFTYYQTADNQPLMVNFENVDGSPLSSEEEMVLKRVNAFIDYGVVPDENSTPGSSWDIKAENIEEVFDPFVDGTYTGNIRVTRQQDDKDGNWVLRMSPSSVRVISNNGTTTGSLQISRGNATVNGKSLTVNEMFVAGRAQLSKTTRHHLLFTARLNGSCGFQGRLITIPLD